VFVPNPAEPQQVRTFMPKQQQQQQQHNSRTVCSLAQVWACVCHGWGVIQSG
jgi:hypothetical protein